MRRKLSKHGNSLAFVIEKPVLDLLGYDAETEFEVTTSGRNLTLIPLDEEKRRAIFESAADFSFSNFDQALQKLAE